MNYVFDIDGTICSLTAGKYENAQPHKERIENINKIYTSGDTVIFYTARGMGRYNNNAKKATEAFYDLTVKQLQRWGVKYHELYMGKPSGDFYVDDKGIKDEDFFDKRN